MGLEAILPMLSGAIEQVAAAIKARLAQPPAATQMASWVAEADAFTLQQLAADADSASDHEDYVWVLTHRAPALAEVSNLLQEGTKLLADHGTSHPVDAAKLRDAYARLRRRRRDALRPILREIEQTLPAVEGRLRQFPIDASLLAYGFMTLVGFVWLCGYYTSLEVEVVPLLRDIRDVFLIGATSGLMPVAIFAGLTAAAFYPFVRIRRVARLDTATPEQVLAALQEARQLRSVRYWWWRCVLGLVAVANVAVLAAFYTQAHSTYDIAVIGETSREEPMRVMGSIGGFLVTAPVASTAPGITIVPIADVKCLQRGHGTGACARPADDGGGESEDLANTISTTLAVLREKDEWHTFVERVGQCRAVRTSNPAYLFSPVFPDNSADLDAAPFVLDNEKNLRSIVAAAKSPPASTPSLNIIGFASGTSYPARNSQLASERARLIAKALIQGIPDLRSCNVSPAADGKTVTRAATCPMDIRAWGIGELPPLSWIGKQGDPSERVVLIAACRDDIR